MRWQIAKVEWSADLAIISSHIQQAQVEKLFPYKLKENKQKKKENSCYILLISLQKRLKYVLRKRPNSFRKSTFVTQIDLKSTYNVNCFKKNRVTIRAQST